MTRPENALLELRPGSAWKIDWDDTQSPPAYTLHWDESNVDSAPSEAEITAKINEIIAAQPTPTNATQFLIDIQQNAAWKTWVNSLPQHDALSLTGAALRENWTILKAAFDAAILEVMPSNTARSEWQTIANNNGIPVTFEAA